WRDTPLGRRRRGIRNLCCEEYLTFTKLARSLAGSLENQLCRGKGKVGALARTDTGSRCGALLQLAGRAWNLGRGSWLAPLACFHPSLSSQAYNSPPPGGRGLPPVGLSRSTVTHRIGCGAAADQRYRSGRSGSAGLGGGASDAGLSALVD